MKLLLTKAEIGALAALFGDNSGVSGKDILCFPHWQLIAGLEVLKQIQERRGSRWGTKHETLFVSEKLLYRLAPGWRDVVEVGDE